MSTFGNAHYYHGIIRKYVVMFGNYFNDITVQHLDSTGTRIQSIRVPIAYGPKESWMSRLAQDPDLTRNIAISLPRLGFEIIGINPAPTRQMASTKIYQQLTGTGDENVVKTVFAPVPYDINMQLSIFVKNADDGTQIVEQILPYFKPEWTQTLNLVPEMGITKDIPTIIQGVNIEDTYEGDFVTRRALVWTVDFMIKGYLFGPIDPSRGIIKRVQIDFSVGSGDQPFTDAEVAALNREERIVITPGLYANGSPTTNSQVSIAYQNITANDDFGFARDLYHYNDGLRYNPKTGNDESF